MIPDEWRWEGGWVGGLITRVHKVREPSPDEDVELGRGATVLALKRRRPQTKEATASERRKRQERTAQPPPPMASGKERGRPIALGCVCVR